MDRKRLVGELAVRHGIVLDEDDPLLVTFTFHEEMVNDYLGRVERIVEEMQTNVISASAQQVENARKAALELLRRAGGSLAEQVEGAGEVLDGELRKVLQGHLQAVREQARLTKRACWVAMCCAGIAIAGAFVALGAAVAHVGR